MHTKVNGKSAAQSASGAASSSTPAPRSNPAMPASGSRTDEQGTFVVVDADGVTELICDARGYIFKSGRKAAIGLATCSCLATDVSMSNIMSFFLYEFVCYLVPLLLRTYHIIQRRHTGPHNVF